LNKKVFFIWCEKKEKIKKKIINCLDIQAMIYFTEKNYSLALKYLDDALKFDNNENKILNLHKALIYFETGEIEKSIENCSNCDGILECEPYVHVIRGTIYITL
jgi:tetratricopeptide (TPR) repeat protein